MAVATSEGVASECIDAPMLVRSSAVGAAAVDYHLAAIWRTGGWDPSSLSPAERLHALRPGS